MTPYKNALCVVNITLGHNAVVRLNACNMKSCFAFNAVHYVFDDNEFDVDQIGRSIAAKSVTLVITNASEPITVDASASADAATVVVLRYPCRQKFAGSKKVESSEVAVYT